MVIVTDYALRENNLGEKFIALILNGGVETVKSRTTGRFYVTSRKCSIPSTLSEDHAKSIVGTKLPGSIDRVPCEPYSFITDSGEEIEIDFTYQYTDETESIVETVLG